MIINLYVHLNLMSVLVFINVLSVSETWVGFFRLKCASNEWNVMKRVRLAVCLWGYSSEIQLNHCDSLELPQIWSADEWFMLCSLIENWGRVFFFITYCIIAFWFYFFFRIGCLTSLAPSLHHSHPPSLICSSAATPNIPSLHNSPSLSHSLSLSLLLFILIILIFSHKADTRLSISPSYLPVMR